MPTSRNQVRATIVGKHEGVIRGHGTVFIEKDNDFLIK
jgi:hypothetical protein